MPRESKCIAFFSYFIGCKNFGWPKSEENIIPAFYFNCFYNFIPILSLFFYSSLYEQDLEKTNRRITSLIHNHINNNIKHYCKLILSKVIKKN